MADRPALVGDVVESGDQLGTEPGNGPRNGPRTEPGIGPRRGTEGGEAGEVGERPENRARELRLRSLVETHYDGVWRTLRRLGVPEPDVDDACQRVFVVAARRLDVIERGGERAYTMGVAIRVASETRRTLRRRREDLVADAAGEDLPDPSGDPETLLSRKRARQQLDAMLAQMSFELRTVFVLREIEGLTLPEIAASQEIPVGTATSRLRRAKELFRRLCAEGTLPGPVEGVDHG